VVERELNSMFPDLDFTVMGAADDVTATDMVVRGEADLSETNSAGIVAKMEELETVAVMINADGLTSYMAQGFVRADSGITSFAQLKGKRSCHEGLMKSCTYMPIGYGVRNNIIDDKESLEETVRGFFSAGQCAAPELCSACQASKTDGTCATDPYNGYAGALRCLRCGLWSWCFAPISFDGT
jgi:hypothetical protein